MQRLGLKRDIEPLLSALMYHCAVLKPDPVLSHDTSESSGSRSGKWLRRPI